MNNNLNSVLIEGNLVRDPVIKTTTKGTALCTFSLASNRYYRRNDAMEQEVSYFDIQTWGNLADDCYGNGKKGRGARVVGRLKQERWSDEDGKARSKVLIVAEHVEFKPVRPPQEQWAKRDPADEAPTYEDGSYTPESTEPVDAGFAPCF
jgi:single-strand DNA-binding protein